MIVLDTNILSAVMRQEPDAKVSQDRMAAAGEMLIAILSHAADQSGLGAD